MKINYKSSDAKITFFRDLVRGDSFCYNAEVWLKIGTASAVRLDDGLSKAFYSDDRVTKVNKFEVNEID